MMRRIVFACAVSLLSIIPPSLAVAMSELSLHQAAQKNDAARLARLIADGANIEARDSGGGTPLMSASHANAIAAAKVLIQAGADVNAKNNMSDSPYLYAGARGHLDILQLTLAHGADLSSVNRYGGKGTNSCGRARTRRGSAHVD